MNVLKHFPGSLGKSGWFRLGCELKTLLHSSFFIEHFYVICLVTIFDWWTAFDLIRYRRCNSKLNLFIRSLQGLPCRFDVWTVVTYCNCQFHVYEGKIKKKKNKYGMERAFNNQYRGKLVILFIAACVFCLVYTNDFASQGLHTAHSNSLDFKLLK